MSYTPMPGTIAFRVIEILKKLPPGTNLSSAALSEELGQPADYQLHPVLQVARKKGAIKAFRPVGARFTQWSLGDGTPELGEAPDEDEEEDADAPDQRRPTTPTNGATPMPATPWPAAKPTAVRKNQPLQITPELIAKFNVETGIKVFRKINEAGTSKWDPVFNRLTAKGQSMAVPGDWTSALRAEAQKRNKRAGGNQYQVGYDAEGKTRLARVA